MTNPNYRISFRRFLTEGDTKEDMRAAVSGIRGSLRIIPVRIRETAEPILQRMDKAAEAEELTWFNRSLDELWDWLDYERIEVAL